MQGLLDLAAAGDAALDVAAFRDVFGSLKRVVDDLTDFGALISGEIRMALGPVSIVELIRSEAGVFTALAERDGGRMDLRLAQDIPPTIETDGARVRQVLRNLLSNACKYSAGAPVTVSAAWRKGRLEVVVEDGGLGLSEADLRLVFEPFRRGAQTADIPGLGLGLALSRRVAEQLGGVLTAENSEEGGARFIFDIPAPAVEGGVEARSLQRPLRILVCEDMALVREVLCANLRQAGHEVTAVADGAAAWMAWRATAFDAAILDWNLPGLGGAALVERLAGDAPVLVLTASSDIVIAQQALAAGAQRVLRKPVSAAELAEAVAALMAQATEDHADDLAFAARIAALQQAADGQLAAKASAIVARWNAAEPLSIDEVHRLAGLAAQFGYADLAAAADAVEASLRAGGDRLGIAVARFAEVAQSASEIPSTR
jgi:CheY-like chemotaxis protein